MSNDNLPILDWNTVKCPECNRYMAEIDVIRHCVDEHPDSLIALVVALARGE